MTKLLTLLLTLIACSDLICAQQPDASAGEVRSLSALHSVYCRPVTSTTALQAGVARVRNTYLSPLLYSGPSLSISHERARRSSSLALMSLQTLTGQFTMGIDKGDHSDSWSGRLRYRYATHAALDCFLFTFMAGPYLGADAGFDYNLKIAGGNNPATARLALNAGLSFMATTRYRLWGRHSKAYLLCQVPVVGYALMPEYGASYYEAFYLGTVRHMHHFTSLHNQQDLDLRFVTDVPPLRTRGGSLRLGVAYHIETMRIHHTINRLSAFEGIVGWTIQSLPVSSRSHANISRYLYDEAY